MSSDVYGDKLLIEKKQKATQCLYLLTGIRGYEVSALLNVQIYMRRFNRFGFT